MDQEKNILWTKSQSSSEMIQVQMDKGIVGFAVVNNIKINVEDAYKDERFNREIDIQTGYKTKSILVVPILNDKQVVVGALQAINKKRDSFTRDDEDLLEIIASFTGGIVKNSLLYETTILKLQRHRKLFNVLLPLNLPFYHAKPSQLAIQMY